MDRTRPTRTAPGRPLLLALLASLLLVAGCRTDPGAQGPTDDPPEAGNGEEPGENGVSLCVEHEDCPLGQVCRAGLCEDYSRLGKEQTGCVADTDCGPTERCATWSGVCVDVADSHPPSTREGDVCLDGEKRTCGVSKVGACRLGYETCIDGQWSGTCVGHRDPAPETCDGRDNDCDGVVDNAGPADASCDDGDPCTGSPRCERGRCVPGTPVSCAHLDSACTAGACDSADGACHVVNLADGLTCDDGDLCTVGATCEDGSCGGGTPVSCAHLDSECMVGECDPETGGCRAVPRTDGIACDDGNLCTVGTTCQEGVCGAGAPVDCSGEDDQCLRGVCDPANGQCTTVPRREGQSCDDGQYCTVATVCQQGVCGGGQPRNCSGVGNQCNAGVCDPDAGENGACVTVPYDDGRDCQDGLFCTVNTTCQPDGTCGGGQPRNCSSEGGSCRTGVCDEAAGACTGEPVPDGTACDDGLFCTVETECAAGECVGTPRDCSDADDACNVGVCNEAAGACAPEPANEGDPCDDGLFCTVSTTCAAGACVGQPRDCVEAADQCNTGVCDETAGACVPDPVSDNTPCDDGLYCTVNDRCVSGACSGQARNCAGAGDQCNEGVCDEDAGACVPEPLPDGVACDDGAWCTVNDVCTGGVCGGAPRDCSTAGDDCNVGVCNESQNRCDPSPVSDGTECSDGDWCSVDEACYGGACLGVPRDCDHAAPSDCYDGVCSEALAQCIAVDNGSCPNQPPIADCSVSNDTPFPLDTVTLDGSGSSDPDGDALTYTWEVVSRPGGSTSQPSPGDAAISSFFVDLAGSYTLRLTVSDGEYTDTCELTLTVVPPQDLHVELIWQEDSGDLDLHMTRTDETPLGAFFDVSNQERDCWWANCLDGALSWGASLDIDSVAGYGPENINIDQDPDTGRYHIGVHNYCDVSSLPGGGLSDSKPLNARVRVYCNGQVVAEWPSATGWRTLADPGDFWLAGYVDWTGAGATGCQATAVDDSSKPAATYLVASGLRSTNQTDLHCRGESSCSAQDDCRSYERCVTLQGGGAPRNRCVLNHTCTSNADCAGQAYASGCDTGIGFCVR